MMKKNSKKAMYDMVKKMKIGGKNPKKKLSAKAQAAFDAAKAAEEEAARQARIDAKKGLTAKGGMKVYKAGGKRPDYPDVDGDGNKTESMEQALKDAGKAYKGMKVKKAKGGIKVYNNGGKDEKPKKRTRRPGTVPDRDKDRRFLFSRRNAAALRDQKIEESRAKMEAGEDPGRGGSEAGIAVEEKNQAKLERKAARRKAIGKRIRKRSNRRGLVARALTKSGQRRMRRLGKKVKDLKAQNVGVLIESEGK